MPNGVLHLYLTKKAQADTSSKKENRWNNQTGMHFTKVFYPIAIYTPAQSLISVHAIYLLIQAI